MEVRAYVLLIVLGCAAVTIVPRVLPLVVFSRIELPGGLRAWLEYVPVSILAGLLAQELVLSGGTPSDPAAAAPAWLAILPALAVASWTKSILGAVAAGVASMALLRAAGWA